MVMNTWKKQLAQSKLPNTMFFAISYSNSCLFCIQFFPGPNQEVHEGAWPLWLGRQWMQRRHGCISLDGIPDLVLSFVKGVLGVQSLIFPQGHLSKIYGLVTHIHPLFKKHHPAPRVSKNLKCWGSRTSLRVFLNFLISWEILWFQMVRMMSSEFWWFPKDITILRIPMSSLRNLVSFIQLFCRKLSLQLTTSMWALTA